jgi:hypothetical protein
MENVRIFYGQWEYFMAVWKTLRAYGNVVTIRHIFHRFGILCQEKSGNPASQSLKFFYQSLLEVENVD